MSKTKTEQLPDLQRRASELNTQLMELLDDAWKAGYRIRVSTATNVAVLSPAGCEKQQTLNIVKRKK